MTILYDNIRYNQEMLLDLPLREGTGIITQDVAKPHHVVDLINTPTWPPRDTDLMTLLFNGTSEYMECEGATCTDLDFISGDYSIGCWFYWESGGDDDQHLIGRYDVDTPDTDGWELYLYGPTGSLNLRHHHEGAASDRTACYSYGWTRGVWLFMGVSRDGGVADFYRNGAAVTTTCSVGGLIDPLTSAEDLTIGVRYSKDSEHFKGMLWRMRVWDRALTAADWMNIYLHEKRWFS